jgi:L-lactate dehydrogenase complex protein LldG
MNETRQTILDNIRNSLGRNTLKAETVNRLEARLATPPKHEQPALGSHLIELFFNKVKKAGGTIESIPNAKDIPFVILDFLKRHNLPQTLVVDSHLKELPWPNKLQLAYRAAQASDVSSVSFAFAGVVETGSLVLLSSPESPTTLNFLPANHIVVLYKDNLVAHLETVWEKLRTQAMPRTVNIITGPSRTADIEQTLQLGAHGPRRLHIIVVEQSSFFIRHALQIYEEKPNLFFKH